MTKAEAKYEELVEDDQYRDCEQEGRYDYGPSDAS